MIKLINNRKYGYWNDILRKSPLLNKIAEYLQQNYIGFHTPGHQQGQGCSNIFRKIIVKNMLKSDLTEIPGLDNLKNPEGCIKEAQDLAAKLYRANKTLFLVNGSTIGLQSAVLAVNKPMEKIGITRHSHISVINGLVLSGGQPVVFPVPINYTWGIPLGTLPNEISIFLEHNIDIKCMLITQPSYQGIGGDIFEVNKVISQKNIVLISDEAHGAHLYFQNKLPLSAQQSKVDIVIHSTHKTLGALTQASMIHINRKSLIKPVQRAVDILQTTSPSYLLMASLDSVQEQMSCEGAQLVQKTWELAEILRTHIRKLAGYRILKDEISPPWYQDPAKVVISAAELGLTGWDLARILQETHKIIVEQSDYFYVLFLISVGHSKNDVLKVVTALRDICKYERKRKLAVLNRPGKLYEKKPHLVLTPRETFLRSKEEVPLDESVGRIASEPLTVYPPGIPLLWPGEIINSEHLEYLSWAKKGNLPVHGIFDGSVVSVITEE